MNGCFISAGLKKKEKKLGKKVRRFFALAIGKNDKIFMRVFGFHIF